MTSNRTRQVGLLAVLGAVAGLAALLVAPAHAGGPLAVWVSGQPFLWPNGGQNIPYNPDQGGFGGLDNATVVALVDDAFARWQAVPTATATYVNAGPLPEDVDETNFIPYLFPFVPDGLSAIVLDEDGAIFDLLFGPGTGVLGFSGPEWGNFLTGEILEGFGFLNGRLLQDGIITLDAQFGVFVHEFGHFSNLAHSVTNGEIAAFGDTSGPTPFNTFPPEDVLERVLAMFQRIETMYPFALILPDGSDFIGASTPHPDDIAIFSTLYPAPSFFADYGTITGTILSTDGVTKVTGVNVIARNVANPYDDAVSAISGDFTNSLSQADPFTGVYTLNGLTPGATYAVFVDQILAGGFSTPIRFPLPGPEELYNGADESFDPDTDDPSVFTGVASMAGVPTTGVDIIFNRPRPGDPLPLGDDDFIELFMPFSFSFCGESYNAVFVNSNGSVSFGSGSTSFFESESGHLNGPPRIAGLWDDLNPAAGGVVTFDQSANEFTVFWNDVPEFPSTGANTFSITLQRSANQFDLEWGALSASDGLAGFSCGGAVTIGNEPESDLTALAQFGTINGRVSPAIYERWTFSEPSDVEFNLISFTAPKEFVDKGEPNNMLADATKVKLPFSSGDRLGDSPLFRYTDLKPTGNDVDFFRFSAMAGLNLIAATTAGPDTYIGLFDAAGNLLESDDDDGPGLLSRIVYPITADGDYFIAVTSFPDFDFSGDGNSGGRYVLELELTAELPLDLGDDDFEEVAFVNFDFPFQGMMWSSVFVNSNGNLTFGTGDRDFSESVSEFLNDQPRIAPLWDDLNPTQGGQITVGRTATTMTVNYENIPEFFATGANSFSVTMHSDGRIDIAYGGVTALDGIVGVTEGGGAADPGETDLSAAVSLSATGTTYERFTGSSDPFDLAFTLLTFLP